MEIEKEKKRIKTVVKTPTDYKILKNHWLNVKNILDIIYKELLPLVGGEQKISLNPESFSPEQKKMFTSVLGDILKREVGILEEYYCNNGGGIVSTSDPIRKPLENFYSGKSIIIKSRYDFENYKKEISELCDFIEKDGQKRFPEVCTTQLDNKKSKNNKLADTIYNKGSIQINSDNSNNNAIITNNATSKNKFFWHFIIPLIVSVIAIMVGMVIK